MEIPQEQLDALLEASAKIEAAEAEKARLDLIGQKNDELDALLASIAATYKAELDEATTVLSDLETVEEAERDQEAMELAINARKAIIERMATECAEAEATFTQEHADVYNA